MKAALKYTFILSGLIPALILLFLTLLVLPDYIKSFRFISKEIILLGSMILGILGFFGLLLSIIPRFKKLCFTKMILLSLGIIGFLIFMSVTGGKKSWNWIINIEEFDEWIIWVWPNIVSTGLVLLNGEKLIKLKRMNK